MPRSWVRGSGGTSGLTRRHGSLRRGFRRRSASGLLCNSFWSPCTRFIRRRAKHRCTGSAQNCAFLLIAIATREASVGRVIVTSRRTRRGAPEEEPEQGASEVGKGPSCFWHATLRFGYVSDPMEEDGCPWVGCRESW